jgi:predicted metal-dependent HD superfamily phosphohydrolase
VLHGAKTIFVMPPRDLGSVSSSFVRALQGPVGWHWSMQKFVPGPAYTAWVLDWLRKEWEALWHYDAADPQTISNADQWFDTLTGISSYGAPTRCYHNLDHLVHGLSELRVWATNHDADPADAELVKKAFWFHDAVYQHGANDLSDEEQSAKLWLKSGLDRTDTDDVAQLIRATDHFQESAIKHRLKNILLGADLAILGAEQEVYDAYRQAIRAEYAHVPEQIYRERRCKVLTHLYRKAQAGELYADAYFSRQYNQCAIENMQRELAQLSSV